MKEMVVGMFDFNDYELERSVGVKGLFEVKDDSGEVVDLVREVYDGVMASEIYKLRTYHRQ